MNGQIGAIQSNLSPIQSYPSPTEIQINPNFKLVNIHSKFEFNSNSIQISIRISIRISIQSKFQLNPNPF